MASSFDSMSTEFTVELFCAAVLYGAYVVLFVYFVLVSRSKQCVFFVAIPLVILLVETVYLIGVLASALYPSIDPSLALQRAQTMAFSYRSIDLCAHAIIVWRIWVLWRAADNWIIVLGLVNVPFMLGVCTGFISAGLLGSEICPMLPMISDILGVSSAAVGAGCFVGRYIYLQVTRRTFLQALSNGFMVSVESGSLYTLLQINRLLFTYLKVEDAMKARPAVENSTTILLGIISTLILTLIALDKAPLCLLYHLIFHKDSSTRMVSSPTDSSKLSKLTKSRPNSFSTLGGPVEIGVTVLKEQFVDFGDFEYWKDMVIDSAECSYQGKGEYCGEEEKKNEKEKEKEPEDAGNIGVAL